jgi:hypothetical protein
VGRRRKARVLLDERLLELASAAVSRTLDPEEVSEAASRSLALGLHQELLRHLISSRSPSGREAVQRLSPLLSDALSPPPSKPFRADKYFRNPRFPFHMTTHALDRFREHYPEAQADPSFIEDEIASAVPTKRRSSLGDHVWTGPSGVLFVVKYDTPEERERRGGLPVCVTVLTESSVR